MGGKLKKVNIWNAKFDERTLHLRSDMLISCVIYQKPTRITLWKYSKKLIRNYKTELFWQLQMACSKKELQSTRKAVIKILNICFSLEDNAFPLDHFKLVVQFTLVEL